MVDEAQVDTTPNCGNMLAAVVPFALETGLVQAAGRDDHAARAHAQHRHAVRRHRAHAGRAHSSYEGDARIDGVPGTSAPITINFLDTAGLGVRGPAAHRPGARRDRRHRGHLHRQRHADGDDSRRQTLGRTGYETVNELNADAELKARLETLRLAGRPRDGPRRRQREDLSRRCRWSRRRATAAASATRTFIPHVCHDAIGVLAAVTVATACVLAGLGGERRGHACRRAQSRPSRSSTPRASSASSSRSTRPIPQKVTRAALLRTARLLMRGEVLVPGFDLERKHAR